MFQSQEKLNTSRVKTALITGASGDIGQAITRRLAEEGWNLALQAFQHEQVLEPLLRELADKNLQIRVYKTDLSQETACLDLVAKVLRDFPEIYCLINNAGVAQQKLLTETSEADWQGVQSINLDAVYRLSRALIPQMIMRQDGCIINIASIWGQVGSSCEVAYSTSKAGLIGFTKALGKELGPSGIRVNCICPGVIEGKMNSRLAAADLQALREATPLWRLGRASEVAAAVAFLASEDASFITCQAIAVDGGFAT